VSTQVSLEKRVPAEVGFWFFILGEMSVFSLFFGAYLWNLGSHRQAFAEDASNLVVPLGLLNTLVLLASSYVVVKAVIAQRSGDNLLAQRMVGLALAGGGLFVLFKVAEYVVELSGGHGLTTSRFFGYYYVLTGLHLMHVAIGSVLLLTWRRGLSQSRTSMRWAECAAGYWHMVDLLWLVIFSIVYIGTHA